jgi:hypothetical protein
MHMGSSFGISLEGSLWTWTAIPEIDCDSSSCKFKVTDIRMTCKYKGSVDLWKSVPSDEWGGEVRQCTDKKTVRMLEAALASTVQKLREFE